MTFRIKKGDLEKISAEDPARPDDNVTGLTITTYYGGRNQGSLVTH